MRDILFSSWGGKIVDNRGKDPQDYEPVDHVELPDYFKPNEPIKALIGWYGLIVRSPEVDIIDLGRAYLQAVYEHSRKCDKCNYCGTGYKELLEVLEDLSKGEATADDLEFLQSAAEAIVESSKCSIGRSGPIPFLQALKYFAGDFSRALAEKKPSPSGRYFSGLTAPCMDACPMQLDIPRYIEHIKNAKFSDSLAVIREKLPLPGVVGRVCFRPCEQHCRRRNLDEPISIKALKRFVADYELSEKKQPQFSISPQGKTGTVAIFGSGPAGITCAYHLCLIGHRVTMFERLSEPGGMSAVGIPDYRLPRLILKGEFEQIQKMGVTVRYNQNVGHDLRLSQLESEFDAVFVAVGAQDSMRMGIEGEDRAYTGFYSGLTYLREINAGRDPYPEGRRVVVVGGGNVAIDCIRSALRLGKDRVHLVYRRSRDQMPADEAEIHDAEAEQVQFHFLTAPVRVRAEKDKVVGVECIRMALGEPDESGRPRPVPVEGSNFVFDCDTVVAATGQRVDLSFLEGVEGIQLTRWNTVAVDEFTKQSSRPKIFVAGDCETGPDALITACAGGRQAAFSIDRLINGLPLDYDDRYFFDKLFKAIKVYDPQEEIRRVESRKRLQPTLLPPDARKGSFVEVEQPLSAQEAAAEAERCLRCYQVATVAV
jgi:formate dehydrogenase beta subunit